MYWISYSTTIKFFTFFFQKTGKEFAAKVFSPQGMNRQNYVTERELNVLKKLKECTHENIVKVIEIEKEVNTVVDFLGGFRG